ncbi:hypothetical protein C454_12673 [Haloferax gibbonsii ATCC 33959]|uniref:Uncharacterized protein n=1 Tax=Haloferax gibbonsii (strain ATCC 33959 / DSM 4427 / JCM 8863 / NBRC 102184 / NCIMB 2188 / Ma 2.38) TaxID=1227459 RepID=M0H8L6_HALGM|nr:hypothetical protein [Haloferax gibbonsii]ELZ80057.1 hypothetical protein C454_12673 [Haloferax gibbonsii ATCC 33959]
MKRRNVITAIGTLAVGTGTVLGTGATEVLSSNEDGSFRVVSPGANISITVPDDPGANVSVFQDGNSDADGDAAAGGIDFGSLEQMDLPAVHVIDNSNTGGGMIEIQVAIEKESGGQGLGKIFDIVNNNSDAAYDVGFEFTTFGNAVNTNGGTVSPSTAKEAFQFVDSNSNVVSSDPDDSDHNPQNFVTVEASGDAGSRVPVSLKTDATLGNISSEFDASGTFGDVSENITLIEEVTAVAEPTQ